MKSERGADDKAAWESGEVGVWYGASSAQDFLNAGGTNRDSPDRHVLEKLNALPQQRELWPLKNHYVATLRRFGRINEGDWAIVYFDRTLHFARLTGAISSRADHPLNQKDGQVFKYRRIAHPKQFRLSKLPDCFMLLATAGRGNIHEFNGTNYDIVKILADAKDESEAIERIRGMSFQDWLEVLGPSSWESLCEAYLILAYGFVPTGLSVGRTLATFDIVGTNRDGKKILAQCKKSIKAVAPDTEFLDACKAYPSYGAFFFAFGGYIDVPAWLKAMDRSEMQTWFEKTDEGKLLAKWLR